MDNLLESALYWWGIGIATIPIAYRMKRPDFGALKTTNGKAKWESYQERLPTRNEINTWFRTNLRNIAIVTGWQNLVIIDFDDSALYGVWRGWAKHTRPEIINTHAVKTTRGIHLYYYMENPPEASLKWPGIDVKASGGYCLIPPSIHPSGARYTTIQGNTTILTVNSLESVLPSELINRVPERPQICQVPQDSPFRVKANGKSPSERIKRNVQILDFFSEYRGNGRWRSAICPFHNDNRESFWIDTQLNRCGCHACINGSMDVIEFYARLNEIDCKRAIGELG